MEKTEICVNIKTQFTLPFLSSKPTRDRKTRKQTTTVKNAGLEKIWELLIFDG